MQRHPSEDIFGIQLAGAHVDQFCPAAELLRDLVQHDFIDVNCGWFRDPLHAAARRVAPDSHVLVVINNTQAARPILCATRASVLRCSIDHAEWRTFVAA